MEQSTTPKDLARTLDLNPSTVRTLLRVLRRAGFVDYRTFGRFHVYHLVSPLPGPIHELLLLLVQLEDVKLQPEVPENEEDVDWMDLWDARFQYVSRTAWNLLSVLLKPNTTGGRIREYERREPLLRELEEDIRHLKEQLRDSS